MIRVMIGLVLVAVACMVAPYVVHRLVAAAASGYFAAKDRFERLNNGRRKS